MVVDGDGDLMLGVGETDLTNCSTVFVMLVGV